MEETLSNSVTIKTNTKIKPRRPIGEEEGKNDMSKEQFTFTDLKK